MSVLDRGDGQHQVRWRDPVTRAHRAAGMDSREHAERVDAAVHARLALDRAQAAWDAIPEADRDLASDLVNGS